MGKSLVIVESPAKAKTINKYLGKDFIVKSSVGHIRDLPTSGNGTTTDPKERAAQAALTRKMAPDEKKRYQERKKREQLVRRMGVDPDQTGRRTTKYCRARKRLSLNYGSLRKSQTLFIWRPIWTARVRP